MRTWGLSESALAELIAPRLQALDLDDGRTTIAFLASGIEGIKVRITAKADSVGEAEKLLNVEQNLLQSILGELIFGVDDTTIEMSVAKELIRLGQSMSVAESLTGGMISARLVNVPGASKWYLGGIVSYASEAKHDVLKVESSQVVSAEAAMEMARGVKILFGSSLGLAITGVAGPEPQEGNAAGTVFVGLSYHALGERFLELKLPGDRDRIRQFATISALDWLRRILIGSESSTGLA